MCKTQLFNVFEPVVVTLAVWFLSAAPDLQAEAEERHDGGGRQRHLPLRALQGRPRRGVAAGGRRGGPRARGQVPHQAPGRARRAEGPGRHARGQQRLHLRLREHRVHRHADRQR